MFSIKSANFSKVQLLPVQNSQNCNNCAREFVLKSIPVYWPVLRRSSIVYSSNFGIDITSSNPVLTYRKTWKVYHLVPYRLFCCPILCCISSIVSRFFEYLCKILFVLLSYSYCSIMYRRMHYILEKLFFRIKFKFFSRKLAISFCNFQVAMEIIDNSLDNTLFLGLNRHIPKAQIFTYLTEKLR